MVRGKRVEDAEEVVACDEPRRAALDGLDAVPADTQSLGMVVAQAPADAPLAGTGGESIAGTTASSATGTTVSPAAGVAAGASGQGLLIAGMALGVAAAAAGGGGSSTPPATGGSTSSATGSSTATSPTAVSMSASGTQIVITFSGALDANAVATSAFSVTVNGTPTTVSAVTTSGSTATLTVASSIGSGSLVRLTYTDPTASDDANGLQGPTGVDVASFAFSSGIVADGYVRGAQIYIDANGNGVAESGEALVGVLTDANGNFFLPPGAPVGAVIAVGGVNIDTGIVNTVALRAPAGASVVNPITTLIDAYMKANPGLSASAAETVIQNGLGLPGVDLLTYDPLSATDTSALPVQKAAAQFASLLMTAMANPATGLSAAQVASTIVANTLAAIGGGTAIDLTANATIDALLTGSGGGRVTTSTSAALASTSSSIASATSIGQVSLVQGQSLDRTAPAAPIAAPDVLAASDTGGSATDNITRNPTPTVRITFNTTALDGSAAVAGDTVRVFAGTTVVAVAVLSAADIAAGRIDLTLNPLADGPQSLSARLTDTGGNASAQSAALSVTIDGAAPTLSVAAMGDAAKTAAEATAAGGVVEVTAETGAAVAVVIAGSAGQVTRSLTGTGAAQAVTLDSANLATLGEGPVTVTTTATDLAGNVTTRTTGGFVLDTQAPAASVQAIGSNVKSAASAAAAGGVLTVTAESGASVTVTFTGGSGSVTKTLVGTGSAQPVALTPGEVVTLGNGAVAVATNVNDAAGNTISSATGGFSLFTTPPSLTVQARGDADKTAVEATDTAGVIGITAATGAAVLVQFTGQSGVVTRALTGTGSVQAVTLSVSELATLGEGSVSVTTTAADAAGNVTSSSSGAFTLDTLAPSLSVSVAGDAAKTAAEAGAGALTITVENGVTANVTLTGSSGTVNRAVTGTGVAQTLSLSGTELTTLGQGNVAVSAIATDAAGNVTTSSGTSFAIDTVAPVLASAELNGDTLILAYTEATALDSGVAPAAESFTVTADGAPVAVTGAAVTGIQIVLTLAAAVPNGSAVTLSYVPPGTGAIRDVAGNAAAALTGQPVSVPSGSLIDGYIRGAQIWIDTDLDGTADVDTGRVTNDSGNFFLPPSTPAGTIMAIGGVNIDTGVPNTVIYRAPQGSTTVSPLTTLVQGYAEANALSSSDAVAQIVAKLGLPPGVDLLTFDPLTAAPGDAEALAVQKAAAQIATVAMLAASAPAAGLDGTQASNEVFDNLVSAVTAGGPSVDLGPALLTAAGPATTRPDTEISNATVEIAAATDLNAITQAQADILDTIAPLAPTQAPDLRPQSDSGSSSSDDITASAAPTLRVRFDVARTDGQAATTGNTVQLFADGGLVGSTVLTETNIDNGYVDIASGTLLDGDRALTAKIVDLAGNTSTASSSLVVRIDTVAPVTTISAIALSADTGSSSTDFLTRSAAQTVTATLSAPLAPSERLFASVDGGTPRTDITASVSGTTVSWAGVTLVPGANTIRLQVSDLAGNKGPETARSYTLDTTAPALAVTDSGDAARTRAEATAPFLTVTAESGAAVNVSLSGSLGTVTRSLAATGAAQTVDALSVTELVTLGEGPVSILARATDAAGNVRLRSMGSFVLDTGDPALGVVAVGDNAKTLSEATAAQGVIRVNAEPGAAVTVQFTGTAGTVAKTLVGDSTAQAVVLNAADVAQLGQGAVTVQTTATDAAGNAVSRSQGAFTLDTLAPTLSVTPLHDGQLTAAEAAAATGVVRVVSESGATTSVVFAGSSGTVTKAVAAGTVSVVLSPADLAALGQGSVTASTQSVDAAGNATTRTEGGFVLDTVAPGTLIAALAQDTGRSAIDRVTRDPSVVITGLESGANWQYSLDNDAQWLAGSGTAFSLPAGAYTSGAILVRQVDAAGNASAPSALPGRVIVDLTPPTPVIVGVGDGFLTAAEATAPSGVLSVSAESGAEIAVTLTGASGTVSRTLTGNGSAQAVTLNAAQRATLGDGAVTVSTVVTDVAGNSSSPSSVGGFTLDTTAPTSTAAVTAVRNTDSAGVPGTTVAVGGLTSDNTLQVAGTVSAALAPGDVVAVYDDGVRLGTAQVTGTNWTFATAGLSNAVHRFTAAVEDRAGNSGATGTQYAVTVDAALPAATTSITGITDDAGLFTGPVASGGRTDDVTPTLTGAITGTLGTGVVAVYDGDTRLGSATVTGSTWSYTTPALPEGAHAFRAVIESAVGNQGAASTAYSIVIDTQAPAAPSIGLVAGDDVVNAAEQAATISGTAEANATVALTLGTGNVRTVTANGGGAWSYTLVAADITAMGQGPETLSATARDVAGNTSSAGTRIVAIDTLAPAAPAISQVAGDDFVNAAEQGATIIGTAEANAAVRLTLGGNIRTVAANGSGAWSYTLVAADITAMGQGGVTLSASAFDEAGNAGPTGTRAITVDTLAPAAPAIAPVAGDDVVNAAEQGGTISGTAEANATVDLTLGAGNVRTVTANGSGAWSYTLVAADITAMGQGAETISATARDAAGNTSTAGTLSITIDTQVPAAPVISTVAGDDVVNATEQGATISGTAEANTTVALTLGTGNVRTVTANGSGAWSYALVAADITAMGQGAETISATARDAAGNTSTAGMRSIAIDTQAPAAPVISQVAGDDVVNAAEQSATISGTAEANATVELTLGTGNVRTVTANGSGAWSYALVAADITAMGQGGETLSATARDAAGNTSTAGTKGIVIDTQAPAAPSIGVVAGDDVINAAEQGTTISGTAEANATVELTLGAGNVRTVTTDGSGAWGYTLVAADITAMGQGGEILSATARDAAGNADAAVQRAITVSTALPAAPTIGVVAGDDVINASELSPAVVISGTAASLATVDLQLGGGTRTVIANAGGAWSYTLTAADITAMGQGAETLSATVRDLAGNPSPASTRNITIDTVVPAAPVIATVAGDDFVNATEQGATISGTAEANATVELTLGTGNVRTVTANGSGAWSYALVAADIAAMGQGGEMLSATARDAAGNTSTAGTRSITIDTQAPAVPAISQVAGDDVINETEQGATISGTAEANATVELTLGTGNVRTVTANGSGAWSYALVAADITAMGQGGETLSATARDAAGNASTAGTRSITIDTQAPAAPVISTVAGDDVVNAAEQGATISGTAEANATVELTLGTGNVRTVTANGSGAWSYTLVAADITAMGQGGETLSATARDAAGNLSTAATRSISVDTLVPAIPTIATVAGDDTIGIGEQAAVISGTAEANATVSLTLGAGNTRAVTVDGSGNWAYTLVAADITAMGQGPETISATARDAAGNSSAQATRSIIVDTQPVLSITDDESGTANIAGGDVLYTFTFSEPVNGFGASGVTVSGGTQGTFTAISSSQYTLAVTPTPDSVGLIAVSVPQGAATSVASGAGNLAATAPSQAFDTQAPAAPVISAVAGDNTVNAAEQGGTISGTAEANATVELTLGAGNVRTVTANGSGVWSYTLVAADITAMGQGAETISATARDAAGNTGAAGTRSITIDTQAPAAPVISQVAGDDVVNAAEQGGTISGTAEANATVELTLGTGNVRTVTANGSGAWSYALVAADITAMGQGGETLSATA
ncbi:MAG: hypothetical protein INH03_04730, partial [Rhodocyclaceae bacterium]|nr:hypothetical protein [Rhodocyclaceae bacterium]